MSKATDILQSKLTLVISVFAVLGILSSVAEVRFALASDMTELSSDIDAIVRSVSGLTTALQDGRIDDLEFKIVEAERRISRILLIPEEEQTRYDANELKVLLNQKERYLRKLDRLLE